jgi:hypothetical protein
MTNRMLLPDLAVDSTHLAGGLFPLAFLSSLGSPAVLVSLINIAIIGIIRYVDMRARNRARMREIEVRSNERLELQRMKLELEAAQGAKGSSEQS